MRRQTLGRGSFLLVVLLLLPVAGRSDSDEQFERWGEEEPAYVDRSGGPELVFIDPVKDRPTPYSLTEITVSEQSIDTGWVVIEQCHHGLDAVPDAEVVYRFASMRKLHILEAIGIGSAWVEGQSVQLKQIDRGARLCVGLEARVLHRLDDGRYRIRYGPFQRRFLDSYFPMHVAMQVRYPHETLYLDAIAPPAAAGLPLEQEEGRLGLEAWFRGKLFVEFYFLPRR